MRTDACPHHARYPPDPRLHALLLSNGGVVDAGPIDETLVSARLSACYGMPLRVSREDGRFWARVAAG